MIVLEIHFVSDKDGYVSMSADVLGKSKDLDSESESNEFETAIIPVAFMQIEKSFSNVSLEQNQNLCIDMMNVLVRQAKKFDYALNRIGQHKDNINEYQLEFRKETNERFMGRNKEICDEL